MRACEEALRTDISPMLEVFKRRRNYALERLGAMGLKTIVPGGAFYVFPNIKKYGLTSEEFATRLLKEEKVAVVPGTAFGESGEGHLRISYAYSLENLKIAKKR